MATHTQSQRTHLGTVVGLIGLTAFARAQTPCFESNGGGPIGTNPRDCAIGDLNGDGQMDVVATSLNNSDVSVFLATAGELPIAAVAYPIGLGASDILLADLDGDGDQDIVTVRDDVLGVVTVLANAGNGTFAAPVDFPAGDVPNGIAAGDLDGDGDLDLAVANMGSSNAASFLLNLGSGTYSAPFSIGTSFAGGAACVAMGDIDADGDLDLVVGDGASGASLSLNMGGATFAPEVPISTPKPIDLALGDVDGDGDLDLVAIDLPNGLAVLANTGAGVFAPAVTYPANAGAVTLALADLDQNGSLDVAMGSNRWLLTRLNSGTGTFGPERSYYSDGWIFGIASGDLDGDADQDIALASRLVPWLTVKWNLGDGTFPGPDHSPTNDAATSIALGDLDGDGRLDAVTANEAIPIVSVYFGPGHGSIAAPVNYNLSPAGGVYAVVIEDMDGDGDRDVIIAQGSYQVIAVGWNAGSGALTFIAYPTGHGGVGLGIGDFDGDGDRDVLAAGGIVGAGTSVYSVLFNQGGTFGAPVLSSPGGSGSIAVGDFDLDLDLDFAAFSHLSLRIYSNLGNGTFVPQPVQQMSFSGSAVAADLDGDLDLDLAFGPSPGYLSSAGVLLNNGLGVFAPPPTAIPVTDLLRGLVATDMDADGDVDLIGLGYGLTILENQGASTFLERKANSTPCSTFAAGDLDEDGDVDLAVGWYSAGLAILRNCSISGSVVCTGDAATMTCPCGNSSAPAAMSGCLNSTTLGATLRADGSASLSHDRLDLNTAGMPGTAPALFFQGSSAIPGGVAPPFGDGVLCASGSIVRLGIVFSSLGAATFPSVPGSRISTQAFVTAPGERVYQVWYRDAASFCTSSTFNLTNAVVVRWGI